MAQSMTFGRKVLIILLSIVRITESQITFNSCGGTINGFQTGRITSPLYPKFYPKNVECEWRIVARNGDPIYLRLEHLDNKENNGVQGSCYDTLSVFHELPSGKRTSIVTDLCGSSIAELDITEFEAESTRPEQHAVVIRFTSDYTEQFSGFLITFNVVGSLIYHGNCSVTMNGYKCQRWDMTSPHKPLHFPSNRRHNFCRSPDDDVTEWCYTTDPSKRWDYCDVTICGMTTTRPINYDVIGTKQSTTNEEYSAQTIGYRGNCSVTMNGYKCQRWDMTSPHKPLHFPSNRRHNFCRSPDDDVTEWCYTTDPSKRWDYCDVTICDKISSPSISYDSITTKQTTTSGEKSTFWQLITGIDSDIMSYKQLSTGVENNSVATKPPSNATVEKIIISKQVPTVLSDNVLTSNKQLNFTTSDIIMSKQYSTINDVTTSKQLPNIITNYVLKSSRSPSTAISDDVSAVNQSSKATVINVAASKQHPTINEVITLKQQQTNTVNALTTSELPLATVRHERLAAAKLMQNQGSTIKPSNLFASQYRGNCSKTRKGLTCQRWDEVNPHFPFYVPLNSNHNFCRTPDHSDNPWCYTTNPKVRYDFCDVINCFMTNRPTAATINSNSDQHSSAFTSDQQMTNNLTDLPRWTIYVIVSVSLLIFSLFLIIIICHRRKKRFSSIPSYDVTFRNATSDDVGQHLDNRQEHSKANTYSDCPFREVKVTPSCDRRMLSNGCTESENLEFSDYMLAEKFGTKADAQNEYCLDQSGLEAKNKENKASKHNTSQKYAKDREIMLIPIKFSNLCKIVQ